MFGFGDDCPIEERERLWIDEHMRWFTGQFGSAYQRRVVLPTDEFFPGAYAGSPDDVRTAVTRVCGFMGVDISRVVLELWSDTDPSDLVRTLPVVEYERTSAAGHYRTVNGKAFIDLDSQHSARPMALIATIAHELAHERLLGEGRIDTDRPDHEPLADLLTVFLGLGVFSANAAFEFTHVAEDRRGYWSASKLGYLTEPMFGYALGRYAVMRGERRPQWAKYLDTNPRAYLKRTLRYLDGQRD